MASNATGDTAVIDAGEALLDDQGRRRLADRLEAILFRHVLDAHWPATRDAAHGGFLTDLDRKWRPAGEQIKSLEFIARQTRTFARAASLYPERDYAIAARHGFEFLTRTMWDHEFGGFFTAVDREGKPREQGRKHPHGHLYALDAMMALAGIIEESEARDWALRCFRWLEDVAWDRTFGGYWGYYHRDNTPVVGTGTAWHERYDWIGTPIGLKDANVLVDAIATIHELAGTGWVGTAVPRRDWYWDLMMDRIRHRFDALPYLYTRDWQSAPDLPRAGQAFQVIAPLLHIGSALGRQAEALEMARLLQAGCKKYFRHRDGGFLFARAVYDWPVLGTDVAVPERSWWVQLEAVRGSLLLALLCPDDHGQRLDFAQKWTFVAEHLLDERHLGFHENVEQADRSLIARWRRRGRSNKITMWKDASHEGGMLMEAVGWLRNGPGIG